MDRKKFKHSKEYLKPAHVSAASAQSKTKPAPERKVDVFVSHAAADKQLLDAFSAMLEQGCGLTNSRIFYSSNSDLGVSPGKEVNEAIKTSLKQAQMAIAIITPNFNRSAYCLAESGAIWIMEKKSLIFVCPPLSPGDIRPPISQQRALNLTGARELDTARDILKSTLDLPPISTGRWCEARDLFISKAGISRQRYNDSRERGIAAIAAELPIPVATIVKMLDRIHNAERIYTILIDIDRLTQINEIFGFPTGSILLDEVNSSITNIAQQQKEILLHSRCGDDTFFTVVYGAEDEAESLARRILNDIARIPSRLGRREITLTASAGVALFRHKESVKSWFERAYSACEKARRDGGNRVEITYTLHRLPWS